MPTKTAKRLPAAVPASKRGQAGTSAPASTRAASAALSTELAKQAKSLGPPSRKTGLPGRRRVKTGRPLAKIDEARVAELAYLGLSNRMIATLVDVNDKTIANRFSAKLAFWRAERALHILEVQWGILNGAAGRAGAVKMAIWLGKNELGQSERPVVQQPGALTVKVNVVADKGEEARRLAEDKTVIDVTEVQQANLPTSLLANRLLEGLSGSGG